MNQTTRRCRLCLESEKPLVTSMEDKTFRARLTSVTNFSFEENEQLPSEVCTECSTKIIQFYTYMEAVRCNQEQLQQSLPPIDVKNEIFLESPYQEFECTVKKEEPEHKTETMDAEDEVYEDEDPSAAESSQDEGEKKPASSLPIEDEEPTGITDEDRLIKEFFSLKCDTCTESFETFRQLKMHAKQVHKTKATLQCCNKSFSFKRKMLFHINTHLKPCKCEECGKGFPDNQTLEAHYRSKHMGENPFKCDECGRSYPTEPMLRTHLKRHVQVDCPICKKRLMNEYTLKAHIAIVHNDERKFMCDVCGKGFKSRGAMDSHTQSHKELKREDGARCEICNTWLSRKKYLRNHMIEKHQSKEVSCDICHKVYPNDKSLKTHKGRVHVEDKFECEICGKRFKRGVNLKEHRASHTGQMLYSCEFCGREMNSNANLYSHKKTKHPEEWMQARQSAVKFPD